MLVFPVSRKPAFGDVLHALRADLHLDPYAVGSHDGRVQRLVAVCLGHRDPVAQTVGFGGVDVGDRRVDLPALCLFGGERQGFEDDADGEQVVDLLEGDLLSLHLAPNGVDAFQASRNLVIEVVAVQCGDDRSVELVDELAARSLALLQFSGDLGILLREAVLHAEVLQLALDRVEPEPVCQGGEEVYGLPGDLDLLVEGHGFQGPHVVEPVGDLDEDHADVVREGQEDLAEVFGLFGGVGVEYAGHLGESVDHRGDLGTEDSFHVLDGVLGVLDDVVQQGCDDRFDAETDLVDDDSCYCNRMQEVWLAGAAPYPLVSLFGEEKCAFDQIPVLIVLADARTGEEQVVPLFLNQGFILGSVSHRLLLFGVFEGLADLLFDFGGEFRIGFQQFLDGVASLSDLAVAVGEPRSGLLDDSVVDAEVDDLADLGDALAEHDVEFGALERGCHLVLDDLDLRAGAELLLAVLDDRHASDVDADRGVEFQGVTARCGLGVSVYDSDLVAQLVDEDADGLGLGDARCEFAQGLGHEPGLQSHLRVAHFALDFGFGRECGHGVDDDDVDGAGPDERVCDFEGLFSVVRLRDEEVVDVDAQFLGVEAVEGVFCVDECGDASGFLCLGDGMDGESGLTGGFGAVDLDDAAFGVSSDAECHVEGYGSRRDDRDIVHFGAVHAHDRAFSEVLLYFLHHRVEHFELVRVNRYFFCHFRVSVLLGFLFYFFSVRFS